MELSEVLSIWWVYPVSVIVATVALSSGISGALFFAPFFLLAVGLAPAQAIGAGLMTELFGTFFGALNYVRQQVVDFAIVRHLLIVTVPLAIVGAFVALVIDPGALQAIFGLALIGLATIMLWFSYRGSRRIGGVTPNAGSFQGETGPLRVIRARDGRQYRYVTPGKAVSMVLCGFGAFLTGLMSSGLPEINTTQLIIRGPVPTRVAVGVSITVLTITVFFASGIHAISGEPAWQVVVWSIPGVITGAQIGPRIQGRIPPHIAERVLAVLFIGVGVLVIGLEMAS